MDINERELLFNQKYLHQQKNVEYLNWVNTILVYIYYLCALVIIYYLFTKYEYSNYSNYCYIGTATRSAMDHQVTKYHSKSLNSL